MQTGPAAATSRSTSAYSSITSRRVFSDIVPQLLESLRRPDAQGHEMTLSFGRVFANSFGSIVGRHEEYSVAMIASPRAPLRQRQSRTGRERINVIWPQFARRTSAGTVLLSMIVL